jgi:hypothetical protein
MINQVDGRPLTLTARPYVKERMPNLKIATLGLSLALTGLFASNSHLAAQTPTPAKPDKPISQLAWLVGGVWTADASKLGNGLQRIETRYRWSDNASYIRFTTHFVTDKAEIKTYDGQFFWDPAKKALELWYMDASNGITQGPVTWQADRLQVFFRGPDFEGVVADLRVDVQRQSDDSYHWSVSEKQNEQWKELGSFDYLRKPDR